MNLAKLVVLGLKASIALTVFGLGLKSTSYCGFIQGLMFGSQGRFEYRPDDFHHRDFVGADAKAHGIVKASNPSIRVVIHPPRNRPPAPKVVESANSTQRRKKPADGFGVQHHVVLGVGGFDIEMLPRLIWILG